MLAFRLASFRGDIDVVGRMRERSSLRYGHTAIGSVAAHYRPEENDDSMRGDYHGRPSGCLVRVRLQKGEEPKRYEHWRTAFPCSAWPQRSIDLRAFID